MYYGISGGQIIIMEVDSLRVLYTRKGGEQ